MLHMAEFVRDYDHDLILVLLLSSRRRHTRFDCDWSSDVCSSDLRIFGSPQELFRAAAEAFCVTGSKSIQDHGRFTVALSGGSTPRGLHQELVTNFSSCLPWDKVFFFWGDERHVPPDSSDSNYRMANETLLSKLPISPENIFRVPA